MRPHNPEEFLNFDYHFKVSIKDGFRVITR